MSMAPEVIRDVDGQAIYIQGYAAVFGFPRADGHPQIIQPRAFDHVLKHPRAGFNLQFHHGGPAFMVGSLVLNTLWVWSDDYGLGFQAGPYTACGRTGFLLRSIADGEMRGASWSGTLGSGGRFENYHGEQTRVIRRLESLDHISVVAEGAYPEAGVWLSSENHYDLPPRLRALSDIWAAHRPAHDTRGQLRHIARVTARLPRRAPASRVAPSRRQWKAPGSFTSLPLSVAEIYPAMPGFSSAELAKLAFQESKYWRMVRRENPGISRAQARAA